MSAKKTEHTPGPWRVVGDYETQVDAGRNYRGAVAQAVGSGLMRLAEAQANARLIAAAPELLEALEAVLFATEPLEKEGRIGFGGDFERARAAIAKAKGAP